MINAHEEEAEGFVLFDPATRRISGGLMSTACLYSEKAAETTLRDFVGPVGKTRLEIRPARILVYPKEVKR